MLAHGLVAAPEGHIWYFSTYFLRYCTHYFVSVFTLCFFHAVDSHSITPPVHFELPEPFLVILNSSIPQLQVSLIRVNFLLKTLF